MLSAFSNPFSYYPKKRQYVQISFCLSLQGLPSKSSMGVKTRLFHWTEAKPFVLDQTCCSKCLYLIQGLISYISALNIKVCNRLCTPKFRLLKLVSCFCNKRQQLVFPSWFHSHNPEGMSLLDHVI